MSATTTERVKKVSENPMRKIQLEKVVVHICIGSNWERLQNAAKLLETLTGRKPILRRAKRTIKEFGISRGSPISCMVTLRGKKAEDFLKRALEAVGFKLKESNFDKFGNFSFGIREHLDIPGTKYDPKIGIFGMDIIVSLERPGYRVKRRKYRRSEIGKKALITKEEAIQFVKEKFGVEVV